MNIVQEYILNDINLSKHLFCRVGMAGIRSVSRLLGVRPLSNLLRRGYADEMNFTFAAGNSVR